MWRQHRRCFPTRSRDCYYDSCMSHSTQLDPIGLEGGLNEYGFAEGDPINFSDPFGLCPKAAGGDGKTEEYSDCPRGSSGYWAHQSMQGNGGLLTEVRGTTASCDESTACLAVAIAGGAYVGTLVAVEAGASRLAATALALMQSNRYLRIGVGRHNGRRVFRAAGKLVQKIKKDGHIDFWDMGPLP